MSLKKYSIIGLLIVIVEIADHILLPLGLFYFKYYKLAALFAILPVTEILVYPAASIKIVLNLLTRKKGGNTK